MGGKPRISNGRLSHVDANGKANMVGVSSKMETEREATASVVVKMRPNTFDLFVQNKMKKGDIVGVAKIAGIQAAKNTSSLIPLCHPIRLTKVSVDMSWSDKPEILVSCTAKAVDRTGVEMEALVGASVAALTVYDMCKAVDPNIVIDHLSLKEKLGGKRGHWTRNDNAQIDPIDR